jgi:hypothetical protein
MTAADSGENLQHSQHESALRYISSQQEFILILFPFSDIDDNVYHGDWADLPELILVKIYSTLNMSQRYAASQVSRNLY